MAGRRPAARIAAGKLPRALLSLDIGDIATETADAVPTEFRIFRFGVNASEKGPFLFDQQAADSVMEEYRRHGKPMLFDYNHGTTYFEPTPEQAIAAGEFTPEVRADGLWASAIKWTDRAKALLAAREYRLFSPFFEFDRESGRITRLINVALTNLPALNDIEPLLAASATGGGPAMDYEKLYNELKSKYEALESDTKALRAKLAAYEEKAPETQAAVSLRATVLQLTGKSSDAEAVGALQALSSARERLADLEAKAAAERATRLSAEFGALLSQAIEKDRKITPAQKGYWEGLAKEDGHEKATARLRGYLEVAVPLTTDKVEQPPAGGPVALSEQRRHIARLSNTKLEDIEKWEREQAAKGTAAR